MVLAAVCWQFANSGDEALAAACLLVVLGSLMVSYTRARAEALGVECKVGIATRPVRVVILSAGLMFADGELIDDVDLLPAAIWIMVALTAFTVSSGSGTCAAADRSRRRHLSTLDPRKSGLRCNRTGVWCSPDVRSRALPLPGPNDRSGDGDNEIRPVIQTQEAFAYP